MHRLTQNTHVRAKWGACQLKIGMGWAATCSMHMDTASFSGCFGMTRRIRSERATMKACGASERRAWP